uniref:Neurotransmitter-gated ion-channel transmembrane domain-containing protein n=1 Tax=Amorphochlora amoebiformis TaxID=1561963 RepID=A0A7S0CQC2_9EUKA|mmetsp:Transcript_11571/g.18308  ORF Transcript_11571/g.18308 Transcript_11571/m.18308 type:complete len:391 (+) Transcript_11571:9-1181(+)
MEAWLGYVVSSIFGLFLAYFYLFGFSSTETSGEHSEKKRPKKPLEVRRPYVFPPIGENKEKKEGNKNVVMISCMVNDILEVDVINESFKPDLGILMDWIDDENLTESKDGMLKNPYGEGDNQGGFLPYMQFGNITESAEPIEKNLGVYTIRKRPVFCRYIRYIPNMRQRMPLNDFPFDIINLDTEIQFGWTEKDLSIVCAEMEIDPKLRNINEYILIGHEMILQSHLYEYYTAYDDSEDPYPEIIIRLTLARNPWYYLARLVVPQILLSLMELTSFLVESDAIADRFSISGTIILSEIALYLIAVDMLPKVPYVTRIDIWFSWCFTLVFLSCVQNGLNYSLSGSIEAKVLDQIDIIASLVYSVGLVFVTVWFVWPLGRFERMREKANLPA